MSLTDVACRNAKPESKPIKLADGVGLYLYLAPTGTKTWRVDYRHEGKRQTTTLGQYPRVSLAAARAMRDELKRGLMEGREPLKGDALAKKNPFQKVANEWLEAQRAAWSPKHHERIAARFRRDVFPSIGKMDIATIEAPDLLKVIRAVEDRGRKTWPRAFTKPLGRSSAMVSPAASASATLPPICGARCGMPLALSTWLPLPQGNFPPSSTPWREPTVNRRSAARPRLYHLCR